MGYFHPSMLEQYSKEGRQAFFQPSTVQLPSGIVVNQYGWLDCPTATEIVIPLVSIAPSEKRTLYWFYEKIVTNSSSPIRLSLEGNFQYDPVLGDFPDNTWKTTTGYTVSNTKDHDFRGLAPIKTKSGEALRLRVHPVTGANNDFYFKFIAIDLPWDE